jgi:hypothetical protein
MVYFGVQSFSFGLQKTYQKSFLKTEITLIKRRTSLLKPKLTKNHGLFLSFLSNLLLLMSLLTATVDSFAATINVFADRNPVRLNESFSLTFEVKGTIDGDPDFSPLRKDFDILNQSHSRQINIINGQQNSTVKWTLHLMAKRTGNLTIPSIYFGKDSSTPSRIFVQEAQAAQAGEKAGAGADLFFEVNAEPENPYVQSQVIYTVRLYYALNISNPSLSEPKLSSGEAIVEKLGEDSQFQTRRDGKRFGVIERKYALFPQQSGEVTIEPLIFEAKIVKGRRSRSFFNNFMDQSRSRFRRLRSDAIALKVRAIPDTFKGQHWLPAKQLKLEESWSENSQRFKAGEPVTRTLTLSADGLSAEQLPEFSTNRSIGENFKQYPDPQPKLDKQGTHNGVISRREEKIAIIPSEAGNYTLPAIEIPWWNAKTDKMEIARLPARTIEVLSANNAASSAPSENKAPSAPTPQLDTNTSEWAWLSLILAIGWLGTVMAWWLNRHPKHVSQPKKTLSDKVAIKKLKKACHSNDSKQAKEALLAWAQVHWQEGAPTSLGEIGKRCNAPLESEIQTLNRFLYSQIGENWQGAGLWKAYNAQAEKLEKRTGIGIAIGDGLEPLYV